VCLFGGSEEEAGEAAPMGRAFIVFSGDGPDGLTGKADLVIATEEPRLP
jgi:hypothetical protein